MSQVIYLEIPSRERGTDMRKTVQDLLLNRKLLLLEFLSNGNDIRMLGPGR